MEEELAGRNYLVTTPIQETWPTNGKIIFLGEWCKLYSKRSEWEKLDYHTLPYHWDDRTKFENDFEYLLDLKSDLLCKLTEILNRINKVNYKTTDWDKFIGWWLFYFISVVFDRWENIRLAEQNFNNLETICLKFNEIEITATSSENFFKKASTSDEWNSYMFYKIIHFRGVTKINKLNKSLETESPKAPKDSLKIKIFYFYQKLVSLLKAKSAPLILNSYLNYFDDLILNLKFKTLPLFFNIKLDNKLKNLSSSRKLENYRNWKINLDSNDFEIFIGEIISSQLPLNFLEGFNTLNFELSKNFWPIKPKFILTANLFYVNDLFNLYVLKKCLEGSKFYTFQHGGFYGIGKFGFVEIHQTTISDKFYTWGWSSHKHKNIIPQGIFNRSLFKNSSLTSKNILLITYASPRYSYHLYSTPISSQWLKYFSDQLNFVDNLNTGNKDKLLVRLYNEDYKWNQKARWLDRFPNIKFANSKKIDFYIQNARLVICTYNATTFLECIYNNIPTIIFWDCKLWEIREEALPYMNLLFENNILHFSPESAALHVNNVYTNVNSWWTSKKVQDAVITFKDKFAAQNVDFYSTLKKDL